MTVVFSSYADRYSGLNAEHWVCTVFLQSNSDNARTPASPTTCVWHTHVNGCSERHATREMLCFLVQIALTRSLVTFVYI